MGTNPPRPQTRLLKIENHVLTEVLYVLGPFWARAGPDWFVAESAVMEKSAMIPDPLFLREFGSGSGYPTPQKLKGGFWAPFGKERVRVWSLHNLG